MHDLAYAVAQREGDGVGVDGGLQSVAGIVRRASPAARGAAAESPSHVARLEFFHQGGSGDRVAVNDRMQR